MVCMENFFCWLYLCRNRRTNKISHRKYCHLQSNSYLYSKIDTMKAVTFAINNESDLLFLQELGKRLQIETLVHEASLLDDLLWESSFTDTNKMQQLLSQAEQEMERGQVFEIDVLCNQK
jgi:hypothetical protein